MSDRNETESAPEDRRAWGPMRPYSGRRRFDIVDPIVEPLWSGARVIGHTCVNAEGEIDVAVIEDLGADVAPELPDVAAAFGRSVMAMSAIVDLVITTEVGLDGIGAAAIPEVSANATSMLIRNTADFDVRPPVVAEGDDAPDPVTGFVAVDLLELDGTSLLDVPLLERKRLLESVIAQSDLIRVSIHARPPHEPWVATWKSLGLRGAMLKAANSRYRPGGDTIEWRIVESVNRRS